MQDIATRLREVLSENAVIDDEATMRGFTSDWFGRYRGEAICVVLPASVEQVAAAVRVCGEAQVAIVPQGGNTSVCGASVPYGVKNAVIVSMSRMNRIRSIDPESNVIVVDAGCVLANVQHAAAGSDRLFPLSLSAEGSCQIGGNIATNAGGISAVRYGTMRDLVIGLEVVLPDGRIWDGLRLVRKDSTGFDLKGLWIGTEGTLGIITGAALKLFPATNARAVAWVGVDTVDKSLALLGKAHKAFSTKVTAFELMSRSQTEMAYAHVSGTRNPLNAASDWALLIELASNEAQYTLSSELEEFLGEAIGEGWVADAVLARSDKHASDFWHIRHSLSDALKCAGMSLTHDVAVPISMVSQYIMRTDELVQREFPVAQATIVCHLGDGNVHYNLTFPHDFWAELPDASAFSETVRRAVQQKAVEFGGTFVAEHGIGRKNRAAAGEYKSPLERELIQGIKRTVDPANMMNPGAGVPS